MSAPSAKQHIKYDKRIHAVVIGIESYEYPNLWRPATGAITDATEIAKMIEARFTKPFVTKLFGKDATRAAIMTALTSLRGNKDIQKGDPILIFYAGHGGRGKRPENNPNWEKWAPVNTRIEFLCPWDQGLQMPGIYDRTLACILDDLRNQKGDNITFIADCCHSGGMSRGQDDGSGSTVRSFTPSEEDAERFENVPLNYPDLDADIWRKFDERLPSKPEEGESADPPLRTSHVLLAAVPAGENSEGDTRGGYFTRGLLQILDQGDLSDFTYSLLIDRVARVTFKPQPPWYDGKNASRVLFFLEDEIADTKLILGKKTPRSVDIQGGIAHGIRKGAVVGIYQSNFGGKEKNPQLGTMEVFKVTAFASELRNLKPAENITPELLKKVNALNSKTKQTPGVFPEYFYAKVVKEPLETIRIFTRDDDSKTIIERFSTQDVPDGEKVDAHISNDVSSSDVVVKLEGYDIDSLQGSLVLVEKPNVEAKREVPAYELSFTDCNARFFYGYMRMAARFVRLLNLKGTPPDPSNEVVVEFHTMDYDARTRGEKNLLDANGVATIPALLDDEGVRHQAYAFTLYNKGKEYLYPSLVVFSTDTLKIEPVPLNPVGQGRNPARSAPLVPDGAAVPVGWANSNAGTRSFKSPLEDVSGVTHYKFFITPSPVDFGCLAQDPEKAVSRDSAYQPTKVGAAVDAVWWTVDVTVVSNNHAVVE